MGFLQKCCSSCPWPFLPLSCFLTSLNFHRSDQPFGIIYQKVLVLSARQEPGPWGLHAKVNLNGLLHLFPFPQRLAAYFNTFEYVYIASISGQTVLFTISCYSKTSLVLAVNHWNIKSCWNHPNFVLMNQSGVSPVCLHQSQNHPGSWRFTYLLQVNPEICSADLLSPLLLLLLKLYFFLSVFSFYQSKDAGIRTLVMLDEQGGKSAEVSALQH